MNSSLRGIEGGTMDLLKFLNFFQSSPAPLPVQQAQSLDPTQWTQYFKTPGAPVAPLEQQCLDYFQCLRDEDYNFVKFVSSGDFLCHYRPKRVCIPPKIPQAASVPVVNLDGGSPEDRANRLLNSFTREATSRSFIKSFYQGAIEFNKIRVENALKSNRFSALEIGLLAATASLFQVTAEKEIQHLDAVEACRTYPSVQPLLRP